MNLEEMYARCPTGQVTYRTRKARDHGGRRIRVFVFDNEVCSACPIRDECVRGHKPRTVTIGYYENKRMAAEERQSTAEFKEEYRQSACVDRVIAWPTGHGARHARYIGR